MDGKEAVYGGKQITMKLREAEVGLLWVAAGQAAQHHEPRHEAQIGVCIAGRNELVHLVGLSEVVPRLGRGLEVFLHRPVQTLPLTLHGSYSPMFPRQLRASYDGYRAEILYQVK